MSVVVEHDRPAGDPRGALTDPLVGRVVAVIGYGNQGRAHALNLRDSGMQVLVGARTGSPRGEVARREGFEVEAPAAASARADLVVVALPDEVHAQACPPLLASARSGATVGFIHGLSIHFRRVLPPPGLGVVMVAPKGPGTALRQRYLQGQGIPCLLAIHAESSAGDAEALALAWASALGCGRAGIVRTTFAHEAETDLFGEQAVLCGGAMELARAAWRVLIEAGYPPELAYIECVHELKQVVDLLFERGFAGMHAAISNTAEFGAYRAGPRLVDAAVEARLRTLLEEIRSGDFARAMAADQERGFPWFQGERAAAARDPIEAAGAAVRGWMPWLEGRGEKPDHEGDAR